MALRRFRQMTMKVQGPTSGDHNFGNQVEEIDVTEELAGIVVPRVLFNEERVPNNRGGRETIEGSLEVLDYPLNMRGMPDALARYIRLPSVKYWLKGDNTVAVPGAEVREGNSDRILQIYIKGTLLDVESSGIVMDADSPFNWVLRVDEHFRMAYGRDRIWDWNVKTGLLMAGGTVPTGQRAIDFASDPRRPSPSAKTSQLPAASLSYLEAQPFWEDEVAQSSIWAGYMPTIPGETAAGSTGTDATTGLPASRVVRRALGDLFPTSSDSGEGTGPIDTA